MKIFQPHLCEEIINLFENSSPFIWRERIALHYSVMILQLC